MNEITFDSKIFYSQLAVFQYDLNHPFNDWNDTHINQGFTWRAGSVSFGTLSNDEKCKITIRVIGKKEVDIDVIRAIVVPFNVDKEGIGVGSIMETTAIPIEEGMYELLFSVKLLENGLAHYFLEFIRNDNPIPSIIKADKELIPPSVLLMEAEPAI